MGQRGVERDLAARQAIEERALEPAARRGALVVDGARRPFERAARLLERDLVRMRHERKTPAARPRGLFGCERREREEAPIAAEAARGAELSRGAQKFSSRICA